MKNLETAVTEVFLKLVMKLNDTTFRPFFITFKDWTFRNAVGDDKLNRQIFFYRFMNKFLETLQVYPGNDALLTEDCRDGVLRNYFGRHSSVTQRVRARDSNLQRSLDQHNQQSQQEFHP